MGQSKFFLLHVVFCQVFGYSNRKITIKSTSNQMTQPLPEDAEPGGPCTQPLGSVVGDSSTFNLDTDKPSMMTTHPIIAGGTCLLRGSALPAQAQHPPLLATPTFSPEATCPAHLRPNPSVFSVLVPLTLLADTAALLLLSPLLSSWHPSHEGLMGPVPQSHQPAPSLKLVTKHQHVSLLENTTLLTASRPTLNSLAECPAIPDQTHSLLHLATSILWALHHSHGFPASGGGLPTSTYNLH